MFKKEAGSKHKFSTYFINHFVKSIKKL